MTGFAQRLMLAQAFEGATIEYVNRLTTWTAEPFGQALLTVKTRKNIQSIEPDTLLRWLPDIIATKDGDAVLIDAKMGRHDTGNAVVEKRSLEAALAVQAAWGVRVIFFFGDQETYAPIGMMTADEIERTFKRTGPQTFDTRGSGTDYWLFKEPDNMTNLATYLA